jgi:hypothetical protein
MIVFTEDKDVSLVKKLNKLHILKIISQKLN